MLGPHRLPCETPEAHQPSDVGGQGTHWVLPATILGSSMSFIDGSVVNVALPAMQHNLATSFGTLQWVVNGYMLTFASLILLGGSAGDRFGRRRIFLIGLGTFALASLICGVAPSASWLVAARLAQGVGAALLTPTSLAIIGSAYSGEARGVAIGTWAAAGALTMALGPPLGGWLVDTLAGARFSSSICRSPRPRCCSRSSYPRIEASTDRNRWTAAVPYSQSCRSDC